MTPNDPIETQVEDSNPNAGGPEGLAGDMGISSERRGDELTGIQGTGSAGDATTETEGTLTERPVHGPEMDDTQAEATQEWRDEQQPVVEKDDEGVDRTVGEQNTAEVPSQHLDVSKNPGHGV